MAIRRRKPKGPKKVPHRLIDRESGAGQALYPLLSRLVDEYHKELQPAKIALAWHAGWKADVDGRRKLGIVRRHHGSPCQILAGRRGSPPRAQEIAGRTQ